MLPWNHPGRLIQEEPAFDEWLQAADPKTLRKEAIDIVQNELNAHLAAYWPRWQALDGGTRPRFGLATSGGSLWTELWYLFALDTSVKYGWRICREHLDKVFYPPRKDRYYCTPEEQQQYSRIRWWNLHKQEQLRRRKETRQRDKKR